MELSRWVKQRLRVRRGPGAYHLQPYHGHGTSDTLYLSGRVFEGRPIPPAHEDDSRIRNVWHAVRRLGSDAVPAARIRASVGAVSHTVVADSKGFFTVALPAPSEPEVGVVWREVTVELIDPAPAGRPVAAGGFVMVPPTNARFGVISDIDDTVVETEVTNLLRTLRLMMLTNAHTRLPFAGVAAFYRALLAGPTGPFANPIFYVSSGPWNFYDLLNQVFDVHGIPPGPIFLKDYGLARDLLLSRGHRKHKLAAISHILEMYRQLPFVLIGDSGHQDPEVYQEAVNRHPGRVLAIYIRDVSPPERGQEVDAITADVAARGVAMIRVQDTLEAAEHAAARGLINAAALTEIGSARAEDLAAPRSRSPRRIDTPSTSR